MKVSFQNKILFLFIIIVIIVVFVFKRTLRINDSLIKSDELVAINLNNIVELVNVSTLSKNLQIESRGFAITNEPIFQNSYNEYIKNVIRKIYNLRILVADNSSQIIKIDSLSNLIKQRLLISNELISARKNLGFLEGNKIIGSNEVKYLNEKIEETIKLLIFEETTIIKIRKNNNLLEREEIVNSILFLSIILLFTVLLSYYLIIHNVSLRNKIETESKNIERNTKNSEERYRHLFERNLAGVYRADFNDVILECNDAFAQIIGFKTANDIIGKHVRELYDNISLQDFVKKVTENNLKINGYESSIRLKDGKVVYLLENASIINNEKSERMYMEGTIFDITDRKLIESQLHKTVNELINKNNDLMQFNYIVSHNLRAPIANILGLVSVLNYQNSESETKKIIEFIGQSILKMDDLVKDLNEMLAVRSLISSKKEIVNIENVIDSIFHSIEKQRVESNAIINVDIKKDATKILTIKSYFESILYNLLSNAIKYRSPLRQLELSVIIKKENDKFKIKISDNGIGIDLVQNGKDIFGLYKRFNVEQEGKGLGLYMVKKQIEAINGEIKIESELNKGTTFLITI
jgi:PAS domain S-box-containing protein